MTENNDCFRQHNKQQPHATRVGGGVPARACAGAAPARGRRALTGAAAAAPSALTPHHSRLPRLPAAARRDAGALPVPRTDTHQLPNVRAPGELLKNCIKCFSSENRCDLLRIASRLKHVSNCKVLTLFLES